MVGCDGKGMVVDRGKEKLIDQIWKYIHHVIRYRSSAKIIGKSFGLNEIQKLRPDIGDGFGFPDAPDLVLCEG
jgi:hypothetical protein